MRKVIRYKCSDCGVLFDSEESYLKHEDRHKRINKANEMLNNGHTLQEIQDTCNIWDSIPEHLKNANKDNCFVIPYWQCCDKPAYQIDYIYMDGTVRVWGCGSWSGYYGNPVSLNSSNLRNIHNKDELFVDKRYIERHF